MHGVTMRWMDPTPATPYCDAWKAARAATWPCPPTHLGASRAELPVIASHERASPKVDLHSRSTRNPSVRLPLPEQRAC